MVFNGLIYSSDIHRFLSSILPLTSEAHVIFEEDSISCVAMDMSNCCYVGTKLQLVSKFDGTLPCDLALDITKLDGILPTDGDILLTYTGGYLIAKQDKSTYKFDIFAPESVRTVSPITFTMDKKVENVDVKDMIAAVNKVGVFNKKDSNIIKITLDCRNDGLHVCDFEGKIDEFIPSDQPTCQFKITISYSNVSDILGFFKKFSLPLNIQTMGTDKPISFYTDNIVYLVAPIVVPE